MANREYIYLRIRACYGARIRLDGPGYVVEIGMNDNERIAIRLANETIVKSVESPGILSCRHLRFYWISWFSGVVEMGRDAPLENVLISWTDPAPMSVTGFSLATETGAEGEWQTEQHPGIDYWRPEIFISASDLYRIRSLSLLCYHKSTIKCVSLY